MHSHRGTWFSDYMRAVDPVGDMPSLRATGLVTPFIRDEGVLLQATGNSCQRLPAPGPPVRVLKEMNG